MPSLDFFTPAELRSLGLKSFGRRVIVRKSVRFINPGAVVLGDNVMIDDFVVIHAGEEVVLRGNNQIGAHSALFGRFGITLEPHAGIASRVAIFTESDDYSGKSLTNSTVPDRFKPGFRGKHVKLEAFTIVGTNSTILPGSLLGEGVSVSAHSLVMGRLKDWGIYAGVPARRIKERRREMLELVGKYEGGE